jgi:hypothetical protein
VPDEIGDEQDQSAGVEPSQPAAGEDANTTVSQGGPVGDGHGAPPPDEEVHPEELENFIWQTERWDPDEAERRFKNMVGPVRAAAIRAAYDARVRELKYGTDPPTLDGEEQDNWYPGVQPFDLYWPALLTYLQGDGWSEPDLDGLHRASNKVVARTAHPARPAFQRKGLVLGHVQAGKTSNFTAVIAKAADRHYRFFIVLSGIHNALREQTQRRLTAQLVDANNAYWIPLTGPDRDFRPPENATVYFQRVANQHVICVVKKNATRLRALAEWLQSADPRVLAECPVIVIDDEADQAGVATTTINGLIRHILSLLPKAIYIGYTATPFANLLIDPASDDLYPEDFILSLPKPEYHYGTEVIFGRDAVENEPDGQGPLDGYDMVRSIPVEELPHLRLGPREPIEDFDPQITPTLNDAIHYFWLATAARRVRGAGNPHSTMLIHTSVRVAVHEAFREPIESLRTEAVRLLARGDRKLTQRLRKMWEQETARVPSDEFGESAVSFEELEPLLEEVVGETRVILDNSRSRVRLNYDDEAVVAIAIGGNTLSRGLTLEGLVVSYFVRAATAYDTLLQMGRWFGYREGYADLPRIWMTEEIRRWFRHLATVEFEIRRDIERYEEENLTPRDFAVRIRTHPALAITAAAKMRNAVKAYASYGGRRVQTRYFYSDDRRWLETNVSAAHNLVERVVATNEVEVEERDDGTVILRDVPVAAILEFFRTYEIHPEAFDFDTDTVRRYIRKQNDGRDPRLLYWNIALMRGDPVEPAEAFDFGSGMKVQMIRRSKLRFGPPDYADIKTLMSKEDRVIDLPNFDRTAARKATEKQLTDMRPLDGPGLLALYPIDPESPPDPSNVESRIPLNAVADAIGLGMVFPGLEGTGEVEYMSADLSTLGLSESDIESDEDEDPDAEADRST